MPDLRYMKSYSVKQKLGAFAYDLPRFLWSMRPSSDHAWVYYHNRDERLRYHSGGRGAECQWRWTSDLHVTKVFPSLGSALMKRALRDWPIAFQDAPRRHEQPQVSFVIGHRGLERLPQLLLTLQSIGAQRNASVECIVVEQSSASEIETHLPPWVRYAHTPIPLADMPYCRAWAFNVGARMARGNVVVLHDNDMLVPREYASEIALRSADGYEVLNLKRFIFFLGEEETRGVLFSRVPAIASPEVIMQNAEGGGSVAMTREAYFRVGGFDESFLGWGGEDNEFWERAKTCRMWPFGYLPIVHLWHTNQNGKYERERTTARLLEQRSAISAQDRIKELAARDFGNPMSLSGSPAA